MIGKFKMVAGDVISIRGQVMEHMYIPTGIERVLVRFGMNGDCLCSCTFNRRSCHFFGEFSLSFHVSSYPYFGTFLSTWSFMLLSIIDK